MFRAMSTVDFKVTPDLRWCPPVSSGKKIRMRAILKESMAIYISLESLINIDLGKKYEFPVFFNFTNENICKNDRESDHASFRQTNELIGYQNTADLCEIWPEHSLDAVKQKCVGDF